MGKIHFGVDLHKAFSMVVGMDDGGTVVTKTRINHDEQGLARFFQAHGAGADVVVEATGNWQYFFEQVEPWVERITLAHPLKVKAIASARIKTDTIDATTLAHLLRSDLIPAAYIPERPTRELRTLLRYRAWLVRSRAVCKVKVRAVLLKHGLDCPYVNVFGKKAQTWIQHASVSPIARTELAGYATSAATLTSLLADVETQMQDHLPALPAAERLLTIPGVGMYSALVIASEIGAIDRFPDAKHLCSYAGLVPSTWQSGSTTRHGHLTKQGSKWLRWVLIEISDHIVRHDQRFHELFERIARRRGRNVARVAVARQLLTIIWYMWTRGEPFRLVPLKVASSARRAR